MTAIAIGRAALRRKRAFDQRHVLPCTTGGERLIEFRDELPKSNVGKILRRELRDEKKNA